MREKYVIRDFHPLVFFYFLGFLMTTLGLVLGIVEVVLRLMGNAITTPTIVLVALLLISGSQFMLFAMWFDMESNKDLGGRGRRRTDGASEPPTAREPTVRSRRCAAPRSVTAGERRAPSTRLKTGAPSEPRSRGSWSGTSASDATDASRDSTATTGSGI